VGPRAVRQRQDGDELVPFVRVVLDVVHEHVHGRLVEKLDLAIHLRVVRGRVQVPDALEIAKTLEEQGDELGSVVRQDCVRGSIYGIFIPAERRPDVRRGVASQRTGRTSLENRSTMIRRRTFPVLISVRGPRRSINKRSKGSVAGNNVSIAVRRLGAILFMARDAQPGHPGVHVRGHGLPVVVAPDEGVHPVDPRMSSAHHAVLQPQEVLAHCKRDVHLDSPV